MFGSQQPLSVEDYTRYFVKKIVKDEKYRDSNELNNAGMMFYSLLQRFAREGDREDVRTPFKIMKDEFMNEWRASTGDTREELIRRLFGVLDIVHEECQTSVQNCVNGTEVCYTILEEFRLRLMKMVIGDTWKNELRLRIEALKHMHKYRNRELDGYYTHESRKKTLKHKARHLTVKKLKRTVTGPAKTSWTAVFNDLLLSSGARLAPLLFAILDENQAMEDHLLAIANTKSTDAGSHKGSTLSVKSGSSISSSSIRLCSETDTSQPPTEEDVPYYYKSLNSELNAKLQLFKQRGSKHGKQQLTVHEEDDSTTHSDDIGIREIPLMNERRAITPFSDEPPPPWCQMDLPTQALEMPLSDGDGEGISSPRELKIDARLQLKHSISVTGPAMSVDRSPQLKKSTSCHTASGFSLQSPLVQLPYRGSEQKPVVPQTFQTKSSQPFDDLDPLNAFSRAFK